MTLSATKGGKERGGEEGEKLKERGRESLGRVKRGK